MTRIISSGSLRDNSEWPQARDLSAIMKPAGEFDLFQIVAAIRSGGHGERITRNFFAMTMYAGLSALSSGQSRAAWPHRHSEGTNHGVLTNASLIIPFSS
jgi:hypothetical protein